MEYFRFHFSMICPDGVKKIYIYSTLGVRKQSSSDSLGVNPNKHRSSILLIALALHEWLHFIARLHCATETQRARVRQKVGEGRLFSGS